MHIVVVLVALGVAVPVVVSLLVPHERFKKRTAEQIVDIPVPLVIVQSVAMVFLWSEFRFVGALGPIDSIRA